MAIDESSPAGTPASAQVSGGTDELRALLEGYAGVLETINDATAIIWTKLEGHRLLRWLRFPAPRALVRTLVVRHASRCVNALKRSVARRAALAGDAPGPQCDLKMLERFEQSLPAGLRLAVIWPLALLGVLFFAYVLANFAIRSDNSKLLGDLTTAAVDLDRTAAIEAFTSAHLAVGPWFGAAAIIAWAVVLVIVPLLPAFSVKRRLLAQLEGLEPRGFAAVDARRVHDIELDLVAQLLLVVPIALVAISLPVMAHRGLLDPGGGVAFGWTAGALLVVLMVFAGVELRDRYRVRRDGGECRHGRIRRLSLLLVWVLSVGLFIGLTIPSESDQPVFEKQTGEEGAVAEIEFTVTAIQQNAACADRYRPLKPGRQFLRFDLDVSSTVDQFSDPEIANVLSLRHWGVEGTDGVLEKDLYMYTKCGDGTEAISQPIVPGTHTRPVVVINAPKPTEVLQLDIPNQGVWRWSIPEVGG